MLYSPGASEGSSASSRPGERLQLLLRLQRPPAAVRGQTSAARGLRPGGLHASQAAAGGAQLAAAAAAEAGQAEPVAAGPRALQA